MEIFQIILLAFLVFALSRVLLRIKSKEITIREFIFWALIWTIAILVLLFPEIIIELSDYVGIGRGVDVIIYGSIALLFYLLFRLYVKLENIENSITKLVREVAIEKKRKEK